MKALHLSMLLVVFLLPRGAAAHGIHAHIHVTGWAIEALPAGEMREFFDDPEVMNAALFGAAFTDSGYWPLSGGMGEIARAYSEHTHWEPFIQDVVTWIRDNDPPPWTSLESKKRAAFFMGCASHGMQDELFDSLFLHHVHHHDGGDQDDADPASDGFLVIDGHLRFHPTRFIPMATLLTLYDTLDVEVTETVIEAAVDKMMGVYVNEDFGPSLARAIGEESLDALAWTYDHYMDERIPGSLRAEIAPTMGYLQAIWARLHGHFDPDHVVVATYPAPEFRLLGVGADSPDSWVTFVYGAGVESDSATFDWLDEGEQAVPFERYGTRWGATWTRLHTLRPTYNLDEGTWMKVTLNAEHSLIHQRASTQSTFVHHFQTPCTMPDDPRCRPQAEEIAGPDEGPNEDALGEEHEGPSPRSIEAYDEGAHEDHGCASGPHQAQGLLLLVVTMVFLRRSAATIAMRSHHTRSPARRSRCIAPDQAT